MGEFYLPSKPDHKILGRLNIGLDGEVWLEIFGNFETFPYDEAQLYRPLPLINGEVADVGRVALIDCCYRSVSFSLSGPQKKNRIDARYALCNLSVRYENEEEIEFNTLLFSVEHLNSWLNFVGVRQAGTPVEGMTISYILPEDITIKLSDGVEIQFTFGVSWSPPCADGVKITQKAYIRLTSEQPRSLFYFTDLADKINAFLCLALGVVVCIKDVIADKQKINNRVLPAIEIYYQPSVRMEKSSKWNRSHAPFQFRDIKENLTAIFNKWIKNYELTWPTYFLYLSCIMKAGYIETMFLSLVHALENLYEAACVLYGWPKKRGLKQKLEELIFTFRDLIPDDQDAIWNEIIKDVVGVRNYLTHYNKPGFMEKAETPKVVYILYEKLSVIIQLHFLKQVGFSNQEIKSLFKKEAHRLEEKFYRPYYGK